MSCCDSHNQCVDCPVRPAAVARIKISHCTRAESDPFAQPPAPERRTTADEPTSLRDSLWFYGVVGFASACTVAVVCGTAGWYCGG